MSAPPVENLRAAALTDAGALIRLWGSLFEADDADDASPATGWADHAHAWFTRVVGDRTSAHLPVIEVGGVVVATAIGTLELGVPNPQCPRGRVVRLANVVTLPDHRGRGLGTRLVHDVTEWARSIDADRVDLSATPDGQRLYERVGFELTKAPRMKLVL